MGSSQSNLPTATPLTATDDKTTQAAQPVKQPVAADAAVNDDNRTTNNKKPKKERKGYDLVQYKCRRRKAAYDKCYAEWYGRKFLTAKDLNQDTTCDELFDNWKECILRGMVIEREREGLGPPKEGSILGEFLEEQSDE